jgi:hypothetical protein
VLGGHVFHQRNRLPQFDGGLDELFHRFRDAEREVIRERLVSLDLL